MDFDVKMEDTSNKKVPSFIVKPRKRVLKHARGFSVVTLGKEDFEERSRPTTIDTLKVNPPGYKTPTSKYKGIGRRSSGNV